MTYTAHVSGLDFTIEGENAQAALHAAKSALGLLDDACWLDLMVLGDGATPPPLQMEVAA